MQTSSSAWIRVLSIVLAIIAGWWVIHGHLMTDEQRLLENQQLQQRVAELEKVLLTKEQRIVQLEKELQAKQEQGIGNVLKKTNKVVTDGWQKLLNTINQTLDKAQNDVQGALEEMETEEGDPTSQEKSEPKKPENQENVPDMDRKNDVKGEYDTKSQPLESKQHT